MSISIDNTDDKQINVNNLSGETVLNINYSENELPGMDLLANNSKKIEETLSEKGSIGGGYSSGEESVKHEDFNFFSNEAKPDEKKINIEENIGETIQDPIIENKVYDV